MTRIPHPDDADEPIRIESQAERYLRKAGIRIESQAERAVREAIATLDPPQTPELSSPRSDSRVSEVMFKQALLAWCDDPETPDRLPTRREIAQLLAISVETLKRLARTYFGTDGGRSGWQHALLWLQAQRKS